MTSIMIKITVDVINCVLKRHFQYEEKREKEGDEGEEEEG